MNQLYCASRKDGDSLLASAFGVGTKRAAPSKDGDSRFALFMDID
jgi:hypothetical protein